MPRIRPKPPAPVATPPKKDDYNDKIAALLSKEPNAAPPAPSDTTASLGAPTAAATDLAMTVNELDALKAQIRQCYALPPGVTPGLTTTAEVYTVINVKMNEDGTVNGMPAVVQAPPGRFYQTVPEAIVRAILQCGPYKLPPQKYAGASGWNEVQLDWDSSKLD